MPWPSLCGGRVRGRGAPRVAVGHTAAPSGWGAFAPPHCWGACSPYAAAPPRLEATRAVVAAPEPARCKHGHAPRERNRARAAPFRAGPTKKTSMGRELMPAMVEGRSHERSSVALAPCGLTCWDWRRKKRRRRRRVGGERRGCCLGRDACALQDAGPHVSAVKLQRSQGWAGRQTKANVAPKKLSTFCSF
jgi:hypothetical protein